MGCKRCNGRHKGKWEAEAAMGDKRYNGRKKGQWEEQWEAKGAMRGKRDNGRQNGRWGVQKTMGGKRGSGRQQGQQISGPTATGAVEEHIAEDHNKNPHRPNHPLSGYHEDHAGALLLYSDAGRSNALFEKSITTVASQHHSTSFNIPFNIIQHPIQHPHQP